MLDPHAKITAIYQNQKIDVLGMVGTTHFTFSCSLPSFNISDPLPQNGHKLQTACFAMCAVLKTAAPVHYFAV